MAAVTRLGPSVLVAASSQSYICSPLPSKTIREERTPNALPFGEPKPYNPIFQIPLTHAYELGNASPPLPPPSFIIQGLSKQSLYRRINNPTAFRLHDSKSALVVAKTSSMATPTIITMVHIVDLFVFYFYCMD